MSKVTIVSCYYPLSKSKHGIEEYFQWIHNFLTYVDTPIVMFGEGEMLSIMKDMRAKAGLAEKFLAVEKSFSSLRYSSPEWIGRWEHQVSKSNFPHLHNQELFRIWANKSFFVEEAMRDNAFQSDIFVWCDAGCWRDPFTAQICGPSWPLPEKVVPNRLQIVAMNPIQPWLEKVAALPDYAPIESVVTQINTRFVAIVGGTILVGDKAAWQTWIPTFEKALEYYIDQDLFAGDDQAVITSAALYLYKHNSPHRPLFLKAPPRSGFLSLQGRPFGDAWFCFQQHFSRIDFTLETY